MSKRIFPHSAATAKRPLVGWAIAARKALSQPKKSQQNWTKTDYPVSGTRRYNGKRKILSQTPSLPLPNSRQQQAVDSELTPLQFCADSLQGTFNMVPVVEGITSPLPTGLVDHGIPQHVENAAEKDRIGEVAPFLRRKGADGDIAGEESPDDIGAQTVFPGDDIAGEEIADILDGGSDAAAFPIDEDQVSGRGENGVAEVQVSVDEGSGKIGHGR